MPERSLSVRSTINQPLYRRAVRKLCWHKNSDPKSSRVIFNNNTLETDPECDVPAQLNYKANTIKTTKYSVFTFLPKNLFEQFHRFANVYFLFIALLNWIPSVNAFGKEIALIPVISVLAITAIKDGVEDYRRYKQDVKVNSSESLVYDAESKDYKLRKWSNIMVGDVVKVLCNQVIPADLLLFTCSEDPPSCFLETANLDGESNLKQRTAVSLYDDQKFLPTTPIRVDCEAPNAELYKFNGTLQVLDGSSRKKAVSKDNLLLRGCILRNTDYVEGVVIYAGHDTKSMMNSAGPRYKRSSLEKNMNRDVIWCLIILIFICFFSAVGSGVWLRTRYDSLDDVPYLPGDANDNRSPELEGLIRFWTFLIIYQVMIPLSLYATLEIVKSCQVYFIHQDIEMYHKETNSRPICRALNITEDLGQVDHVFSDKTGTLTENKMVFKACSIGRLMFKVKVGASEAPEESDDEGDMTGPTDEPIQDAALLSAAANNYTDKRLTDDERRKQQINEFLILLATCNTVVVSSHSHNKSGMNGLSDSTNSLDRLDEDLSASNATGRKDTAVNSQLVGSSSSAVTTTVYGTFPRCSSSHLDVPLAHLRPVKDAIKKAVRKVRRSFINDDTGSVAESNVGTDTDVSVLSQSTLKSRYEAESPDELALVKAVCNHGCRLTNRTNETVSVYLPARGTLIFKVLAVLPFDSVRKCMSVVLEPEGSGDELIMYTKGADNVIFDKIKDDKANQKLVKLTRMFVNHFAKDGLRTLCMAKKSLTRQQFDDWYDRYADCEVENLDEHQFNMCNELESGLNLLGSTGIEDRLQDGVPESIQLLQEAGIKVWVLTGDKQETAINIGYSCGLLPQEAAIITFNVSEADEIEGVLQAHLRSVEEEGPNPPVPRCLVVDGQTLGHVFHRRLHRHFLSLAESCISVLCCRTTPSQKAQIVDLVKTKSKKLCLSIGDGANDVTMIRQANVGVGITGLEGRQASMAADFSIARFRHLVRLLFVHGHWTYDRLAVMTLYNFFKNSNLIFVLFWYQIYCMYSGQNHIDQIYLVVFHLLFTSLPPLVLGILDQDLPADLLMSHPRLYKQGPQSLLYRPYSYWLQIIDSLYQSLVIFFIAYFHYVDRDIGIWSLGTIQCITLVCSQLVTLAIETKSWHWPYISSLVFSIILFWLFITILSIVCVTCDHPSNPYWVTQRVLVHVDAWLVVLLSTVTAVIPRLVCRTVSNVFFPSDVTLTRMLHLKYKNSAGVSLHFPPENTQVKHRRTVNIYRFSDHTEEDSVNEQATPNLARA